MPAYREGISKEEFDAAIQEAWDSGYSAGRADEVNDYEYSVDHELFPDPDDIFTSEGHLLVD